MLISKMYLETVTSALIHLSPDFFFKLESGRNRISDKSGNIRPDPDPDSESGTSLVISHLNKINTCKQMQQTKTTIVLGQLAIRMYKPNKLRNTAYFDYLSFLNYFTSIPFKLYLLLFVYTNSYNFFAIVQVSASKPFSSGGTLFKSSTIPWNP